MSPREYLAIAGQEFRIRLSTIDAGSWGLATPCDGWSVRELVNHVVAGNRRAAYLLDGASHDEASALVDRDLLGDDALGAFDQSLAAQVRAFAQDDALERACETAIGEISARQLLRFRTTDLVVHSWDVARAIGTNESLNAPLVEHAWKEMEPMVPVLGSTGFFGDGPSGTLPQDAPTQLKLLDASGRRP